MLAQLPDEFKRLNEVSAGDRLTTYNHTERDNFEETDETRIDPDTWRLVTVRQDKSDAGTIEADLLRPLHFFGGQWPVVGDELELDMHELGLAGPVEVTAIGLCPSITFGPGRIVLSVFRHSRGSTGALYLAGHTEPIRVTPLHPIWSPSHNAWIPASQLTALHDVSLWKSTCRVERYEMDTREEPVYNVEVDGDHCYRVSEHGLLAHNQSAPTPAPAAPTATGAATPAVCPITPPCPKPPGKGTIQRGNINSQIAKSTRPASEVCKDAKGNPIKGVPPGYQGHHIISVALASNTAIKDAVADGYDVNNENNGIALPDNVTAATTTNCRLHFGSHIGLYNKCVTWLLEQLEDAYTAGRITRSQLCGELKKIEDKLRKAIISGDIWLQHKEPSKGTFTCPSYP